MKALVGKQLHSFFHQQIPSASRFNLSVFDTSFIAIKAYPRSYSTVARYRSRKALHYRSLTSQSIRKAQKRKARPSANVLPSMEKTPKQPTASAADAEDPWTIEAQRKRLESNALLNRKKREILRYWEQHSVEKKAPRKQTPPPSGLEDQNNDKEELSRLRFSPESDTKYDHDQVESSVQMAKLHLANATTVVKENEAKQSAVVTNMTTDTLKEHQRQMGWDQLIPDPVQHRSWDYVPPTERDIANDYMEREARKERVIEGWIDMHAVVVDDSKHPGLSKPSVKTDPVYVNQAGNKKGDDGQPWLAYNGQFLPIGKRCSLSDTDLTNRSKTLAKSQPRLEQ
jgi:hypothetical protein